MRPFALLILALPIFGQTTVINGWGDGGVQATLTLPKPTKAALAFSNSLNNQGTYSQTDTALGVMFSDTATTGSAALEGSFSSYPATPFTYTVMLGFQPRTGVSVCFSVAASMTGATENLCEHDTGAVSPFSTDIEQWNTPTTYSTTVANTEVKFLGGSHLWMRIKDDGTNLIYSVSYDGVNWSIVYQVAKASDFLSSNGGFHYIGIIIAPYNSTGGTIMLGQQITTP